MTKKRLKQRIVQLEKALDTVEGYLRQNLQICDKIVMNGKPIYLDHKRQFEINGNITATWIEHVGDEIRKATYQSKGEN